MVVVGGGFIGSALATIFSRLGTKVSVVEESSRLLPQIEKEIVTILEKEFNDNSIQIYPKTRVMGIAAGKRDDLSILIDHKGEQVTIEAQYALMSEGREANVEGLGLKEAEMIQHSMITKSIERAQKKVEENNFGIRKRLLEYDDVMNSQREVIYKKRRHASY